MAKKLKRLRIAEFSTVDRAANPGAKVVMLKRDKEAEMEPVSIRKRMADRSAALMQADPTIRSFESAVAKIATSRSEADQALWREYKAAPPALAAAPEPAPVEEGKALRKLKKRAKKLRKADPSLSEAAAFAKAYAANPDLAAMQKMEHFQKSAPPFLPQVDDGDDPAMPPDQSPAMRSLKEIAAAIIAEYPKRRLSERAALTLAARTPKGQSILRAAPEIARLAANHFAA